jgi:RimJ/RimL family protein N-acetyltransferase
MDLQAFAQTHLAALETDEVRFNVHIAVLTSVVKDAPAGFACWTLGEPGHCAIRSPGRAILLGNLEKTECQQLARETLADAPAGVIGADDAPHWYAEHTRFLGARLGTPIPQRIHVLGRTPRYPGAAGAARPATTADAPLLLEWLTSFCREAVPHDPMPSREDAEKAASSGRYLLWALDGDPVAMAAIARRTRHTAAISSVYTPPAQRGRGYAGSVTAAVADRIFAEGKSAACLYTDLRNPFSNRCYAKIGFVRHCESWHYPPASRS